MADYIMELRQLVGHRPLIYVGASVIVVDKDGALLLQQRRDCLAWGYAGGAVELYEDVQDTARRELFEETGIRAGEMTLLGVYSGERMRHVYPNGDQVSCIDIVYVCRDWTGTPRAQESEVAAIGFFPPDALPTPLFAPNLPAIEDYLQKYHHT